MKSTQLKRVKRMRSSETALHEKRKRTTLLYSRFCFNCSACVARVIVERMVMVGLGDGAQHKDQHRSCGLPCRRLLARGAKKNNASVLHIPLCGIPTAFRRSASVFVSFLFYEFVGTFIFFFNFVRSTKRRGEG